MAIQLYNGALPQNYDLQINTAFRQTEAFERLSEMAAERNEDQDKAGYSNTGDTNGTHGVASPLNGGGPVSIFTNMQGGNDGFGSSSTNSIDTVYGGSGNDTVRSGAADDTIYGGSGDDRIFGEGDDDYLSGGSGNDVLDGGKGVDELWGGTGNDILTGGAGLDILYGGADNDILFGDGAGVAAADQGRDVLFGGFGNDTLIGGGNADTLWGGAGADVFVFQKAADLSFGHTDVIRDFDGDLIDLRGIDALARTPENEQFSFRTSASTEAATLWLGEVSNGRQTVYMNLDGGEPDLTLIVEFGGSTRGLLEADFLL